ncbi:Lsr2 family protein [Microbacterium sp.]|uniref:histone-like nucleoid-structuring protein Lsr2 n=1 Tax=Microbacterium sp. TaxID=51671 RepID=UPI0028110196|nr:Lsr2 family protein [Microbacterium sp.]
MARRIVHQLVDDIDGALLEAGEGETVHFSLNGVAYEIDLTTAHADELRDALAPYIDAGRRTTGGGSTRTTSSRRRAPRSADTAAIREWAKANGHKVSERGRISAEVMEAYNAAN